MQWISSSSVGLAEPRPQDTGCSLPARTSSAREPPLLTAVREPYVERWRQFHGGLGAELPCSAEAVLAWFDAIHRTPQHREQSVHAEPAG
ncbi:DUF2478 domain-containing protein [Bradyrhizobium sp. SZCCHNRI3043]|uniref:DUF2478 domain-containing protein n=1 Tax=unclassified Bradyrhizobium TaxID=2631580 RepID=UPI00396585FA